MLTRAMRATRAWELLHDPHYCVKLRMVDLYELMVRAGYSEDAAQQAANQRGRDRLDAGADM